MRLGSQRRLINVLHQISAFEVVRIHPPLPTHEVTVISRNLFVEEIEQLCKDKNLEYIDAVVIWCKKNNLEVETAAYWIKKDPTMKSKIKAEAETLNIIKSGAKLPI